MGKDSPAASHGSGSIRLVLDTEPNPNRYPSALGRSVTRLCCGNLCRRTRSGRISRNDFALHASIPSLPFGGAGESGMGYHAKAGFDTFSHHRPLVETNSPVTVSTLPVSFTTPLATGLTAVMRFRANALRRIARSD